MKWTATLALVALFAFANPCRADVREDVLELHKTFAGAQNRRDIAVVRNLLSDRPEFLWISDGKPFWGREAMLQRMSSFQNAELWRVEPEYAAARVVELGDRAAYLHIPLVLHIGKVKKPTQLKWLVEVLCENTQNGWRIVSLFTAEDKR